MADKIKRISATAFEKATESAYEPTVNVEWNGLPLVIKRHLNLAEMAKFVDVCVKACFNPDDASYSPEVKDLAIRSCIVALYTNVTLPENIAKQYELIYHSMILDIIYANVDQIQLDAIIRAIDDKVEHLAAANIEMVNKQMNDLYGALDGVQKQMSEMFDGRRLYLSASRSISRLKMATLKPSGLPRSLRYSKGGNWLSNRTS